MALPVTLNRLGIPLASYCNTKAKEVKRSLQDFGLCRSWLHLTVSRLGNLPPAKFQSYVRLLDKLNEIAEQDGVLKRTEDGKGWIGNPLKVVPPSVAALNSINVEKVMNNQTAWQEVLRVVYLPEKEMIDLRELVWINKRFCRK